MQKPAPGSIAAKCLRTLSSLFSPDIIDQSRCRIMTTHARARPILHADWSIRLGENRPDRALKHLAAMLSQVKYSEFTQALHAPELTLISSKFGCFCRTLLLNILLYAVLKGMSKGRDPSKFHKPVVAGSAHG